MSTIDGPVFDVSALLAGTPSRDLFREIDRRRDDMASLGVARSILIADRRGPAGHPDAEAVDFRDVLVHVERHPDVFSGGVGVDPTRPRQAVDEIRSAVGEGFVVVHTVPHAYGLAPDDRAWYPIYAACCELDVPIQIELGVRRSAGARIRSVGRPISVDAVACDFPTLRVIGLGPWPWVDEAISIAYKHQQVFLALGGDHPGAWHPSLVHFADSWGRGKVVLASTGASLADVVARARQLELRTESGTALFIDSACRALGLDRT